MAIASSITYYHAGCPVCIEAENTLIETLARAGKAPERVHLGEHKERVAEAKQLGVKSVPAIAIGDTVIHLNFGANLSDLEG